MDKTILQEYIDACELIRETEEDIRKLRRKKQTVVQTHVKGSNPVFPYRNSTFVSRVRRSHMLRTVG